MMNLQSIPRIVLPGQLVQATGQLIVAASQAQNHQRLRQFIVRDGGQAVSSHPARVNDDRQNLKKAKQQQDCRRYQGIVYHGQDSQSNRRAVSTMVRSRKKTFRQDGLGHHAGHHVIAVVVGPSIARRPA